MGGGPALTGDHKERVRGDGCREPPCSWSARDDVSSHLYRFERKVVRDLAWALTSPHVVGDPDTERDDTQTQTSSGDVPSDRVTHARRTSRHPRVFPDEDAKRLLEDSKTWLDALDADPKHLLDWIASQRGSNKLGFYFGALVEYGVRFNPKIGAEAVTVHRQVAKSLGAGRMVGQLKLVFRSRGEKNGTTKITHWEYNVKYFVDAGCCFGDSEAPIEESNYPDDEPISSLDRVYVAHAIESRYDREMDDLRDYRARGSEPPPAGDSCYVGPFLHENLHIRVREASRKLALARHKNVAAWLDRWASGSLEGEAVELTDLGERRERAEGVTTRDEKREDDDTTKKARVFEKVSQQILRGYLFYPLRGDGRGGSATWRDARARGTASDAHLRGWWVRTPEELIDVKAVNENTYVANDKTVSEKKINDGSDGDGRMWALFTRKCHWLGPCVATYCPDASERDGADTEWIVRGVPELNIRDVEVVPTSVVVEAAKNVLRVSDRGVLVAELVRVEIDTHQTDKSMRSSHDTTFEGISWRENSRGFVLPPNWDPWPTALRVDPFRRRYERQVAEAEAKKKNAKDDDADGYDERFGKTEKLSPTEVVFDEMYPDREDVDALGDDVRVRDWGSHDERRRRDASATFEAFETKKNHSSDDGAFRNGTSDVTQGSTLSPRPGAVAGASFTDAVTRSPKSAHPTHALLFAVKNALDLEGVVVRPARPSLVRALATVGGETGEHMTRDSKPRISGFSGLTAREFETKSTRALVESAVRGAAACLAALGDVANLTSDVDSFENETSDEQTFDDARTSTRRFSMSTRRAVSHALLDALGPATRRNGCVGDTFAPHASKVFEACLSGFISRKRREVNEETRKEGPFSSADPPTSSGTFTFFSGVCPRVAVRFAKILRVSPARALSPFPGAATRMAEALVSAHAAERSPEQKNEGDKKNMSSKSDAPASRAGAVAELLAWSGESANVPNALVQSLSKLCVSYGHASAAEVLLKTRLDDAFFLRARLAQTHAEAGNHRAARRLAGESLLDELRKDAEEVFAFLSLSESESEPSHDDVMTPSDDGTLNKSVLASALGDGVHESIVLANDLSSLSNARALLERLTACTSASSEERRSEETLIVGFDCEWRPGPGDASTNPVTVAQFAFRRSESCGRMGNYPVVVLDCAAAFGPDACDKLATAAAAYVRAVFENCLLVGFGVASDARRLVHSYPKRFFPHGVLIDITATTVCVRDVAVTLGASANSHASSLSNLCASVLGPNDALDKTEQTSRWDVRPLRSSQVRYAALDALAPLVVLFKMLEKRANRMFKGDVSNACVPWTKVHKLSDKLSEPFATSEQTRHPESESASKVDREFVSSLPPRTDADVRRALSRLGALTSDADADADADACLAIVDGWREASLKETTAIEDRSGERRSPPPLLCKTLAVVVESLGEFNEIKIAATCVLPARDSVRLDLRKAAEALGVKDVSNFRLRLANEAELHRLFGFAAGSVGPFGLRDSVKELQRATVMDESFFLNDDGMNADGSLLVAVGGGAPDVKVVGTAFAVAKHADAKIARITKSN